MSDDYDDDFDFDFDDDDGDYGDNCIRCDGEGTIVICPDDMCRGRGACIHGDGEITCPDCDGRGWCP